MSAALVSVVMPAFNAGRYIEEALDSVFRQTHSRIEVIVVDDGSTDDTAARLEPYRSRLRYVSQANAGPGAARNRGIECSSGDYIAFLDADDVWQPEKLRVQLDVAARNPGSGLIACDGVRLQGTEVIQEPLLFGPIEWRMRAEQREEITGRFYRDFIRGVPICSSSQVLIPRRVATRVGPMATRAEANGASDWDYTLRIALQFPVTLHRHPLVGYRVHDESLSGPPERRPIRHALWRIRVLRRHRCLCAPEDRPLVSERFLAEVREAAYRAYDEGRGGDRAFARKAVWELIRRAPWEPRVWVAFGATWFPPRLVSVLARRSPRAIGGFAEKRAEAEGRK